MNEFVAAICAAMTAFAIFTAWREIKLYRKATKGEVQYLISQKRLKRRLLISLILLGEAGFLLFGFFFLHTASPHFELLFWVVPFCLILLVLTLTFRDLHETRKDVDLIFREARDSALKMIQLATKSQSHED
ncbi:MAG TPA: hypothetical protein VFG11_06355 [Acidobacteriota bacterium]|nr:hypothetical protein [Acidobacteriota bacterium]